MPLADLQALTQQMFSAVGRNAGDIAEFYKENVSTRNRKRNRDILEFADLSNLDAGLGDVSRLFSTLLTMKNSPVVETEIIISGSSRTGVGESGVPPIAPAVTNAIFAATEHRIRRLPVSRYDFF